MTWKLVHNNQGPDLGYSKGSGVSLLERDGLLFKDLNKNGELDPYEDWRLSPEERAADLARRLSVEDIAGLMLFTAHLPVPDTTQTYNGVSYAESGAKPYDLSDRERSFFRDARVKHTLVTAVESPSVAARWNNTVQELAEGMEWGIPVAHSSDPRHGINADTEFNEGAGGKISHWPEELGLGATFDPALVRDFGRVAAQEYRALGLTLTLSPQIDLGTEPRWMRISGSFSESPELTADMARAYIDGFQTTPDSEDGWGAGSVNTMAKHWPGGGPCEAGRDAHFEYGKYAVYPGDSFSLHQIPYDQGALKLDGPTGRCSSIMPYYAIEFDQDTVNGENVGNSYSSYLIDDMLRKERGYDGVVCTDWCITGPEPTNRLSVYTGDQCWGVEEGYTVADRHKKILEAGVDQFGGNKDPEPVLEAYQMLAKEHGEQWARERFEVSARRILINMLRVGLFENAYVDPDSAEETVGSSSFVERGRKAQRASIVLLKNEGEVLPLAPKTKVYVPERMSPEKIGWMIETVPAFRQQFLNLGVVANDFTIVDTPEEADVALVRIKSPERSFNRYNGYDTGDIERGGTGYVPISLQYRPYTAEAAREVSIAGDAREASVFNRTYRGKRMDTLNEGDLDLVIATKQAMGDKPVVVMVNAFGPFVPAELEPYADALLIEFGVETESLLDVLTGRYEPSGLLPVQLPANMETVELQYEDVPFDMECYVDSCGHAYDFGYGLSFSGVIDDERTERYVKHSK